MKNMGLWNKVKVTDPAAVKPITGNCTIWNKAKTPQGYGVTTKNNKTVYAHRVAAEEAYGPIPEGMMVCHRCDNPSCVNPDHLFFGTHKDNMNDMKRKGRSAGGDRHKSKVRPDSVQHGEAVGTSRLTAEQVGSIRSTYKPGKSGVRRPDSLMSLARQYGVSYTAIHKIVNRETWA